MNTLRHFRIFFVFAVAAVVVTALPLQAAPANDGPVADVLLGVTQVQWSPQYDYAGLRLTVSGPNGTDQYDFGPGEAPLFDLASVVVADIDGQYSWELRATPKVDANQISAAARTPGFAGGERQRPAGLPPEHDLVQSGTFRVVDGAIVQPAIEGAPELMVDGAGLDHVTGGIESVSAAAQVFATDLIVQGSACVGVDCTSSESFGFDTLRLKENNLRIDFTDTSSSGSFPTVDWTIVANDSANGGASYLAFQDDNAGRVPFRVDAGAPTNALRVEGSGDIGMGTDNPVVELHIVDGDTPTLRLQQDGSAGFQQQTWDIAGNEANFFVRDVTNGSRLSFRIQPGAPESSIYIDSAGDVGIGTDNPAAPVHIVRNSQPGFSLQDNSGTGAALWDFELNTNGIFQITQDGTGGFEVQVRERLDGSGVDTMEVAGSIEATAFNVSSSRTFKTGFQPVDAASVLARVVAMPVSEWTYKWDADGTRHIGPMAEDFMEKFSVGRDSSNISLVDAAGVAFAAIQGLHQELSAKEQSVQELQLQNAELLERQATLEQRLEELQSLVGALTTQN